MRNFFEVDDLDPRRAGDGCSGSPSRRPASWRRLLAARGWRSLFEKPSARTRNSTEMAVVDLGGHPVYIQGAEVGLDERETAEDVARTLGCYHRVICARVFDHAVLVRMAERSRKQEWTRAGGEPALRHGTPVPGPRRSAHHASGLR